MNDPSSHHLIAGPETIDVTCLVLLDADNSFLVTRRPPGKRLGNLWEFPGGKVDPGEDPADALRREIREELCLTVGELLALSPAGYQYDFGSIRLLPFLVRCAERPAVQLMEHTQARWIHLDEANELDWVPADLPILDGIRKVLDRQTDSAGPGFGANADGRPL